MDGAGAGDNREGDATTDDDEDGRINIGKFFGKNCLNEFWTNNIILVDLLSMLIVTF